MQIDLRSDTVTIPVPEMVQAMAAASVGDDVYGEDPTVAALEHKLAEMFGKHAAMFCPSGTMANQIAIKLHTKPMDEVICEENAHVYLYEGGGIAFHSGCSIRPVKGDRGRLTAELIEPFINPDDIHMPCSSLVVLENTANKGGGSCYDIQEIEAIYHLCKMKKLKLHLDGARLFNAIVKTGDHAKDYGRLFDTISICLSKGLGAPVGSVLLGSEENIKAAKRLRKIMGGGMRQAGYLAAAGIYALDHHVERLKEDHYRAANLAEALNGLAYVESVVPVETNIVIFSLERHHDVDEFVAKLAHHHILCSRFGPNSIRFVTHLGITDEKIAEVIAVLKSLH